MRPITRELVTDRRTPALRWTAVFAGAVVSAALWLLLQMFGMGVGLAAIDLDDAGSLRNVGIGTTVWTIVAPLFSLFVGGLVAGELAATYDKRVAATTGFVTWAVAAIVGTVVMASVIGMLTGHNMGSATAGLAMSDDIMVHPSLHSAHIQQATENTGTLLLGASISLLVGMASAVGGAVVVARKLGRPRKRRITQEVPVVPPPPEPPADAPHVTAS